MLCTSNALCMLFVLSMLMVMVMSTLMFTPSWCTCTNRLAAHHQICQVFEPIPISNAHVIFVCSAVAEAQFDIVIVLTNV